MNTTTHAVLVSAHGATRPVEFVESTEAFLQHLSTDAVSITPTVGGQLVSRHQSVTKANGNLQATAYHKLNNGERMNPHDYLFAGPVLFIPTVATQINAQRALSEFQQAPQMLAATTFLTALGNELVATA